MNKKRFSNETEKNKRLFYIGLVVIVLIIGLGIWFKTTQIKEQEKPVEVLGEPSTYKVFVTTKEIEEGSVLTVRDYKIADREEITSDAVTDITDLEGKPLKYPLVEGQIISKNDLMDKLPYEQDDRFVEHTFMNGAIPVTMNEIELRGKFVDVVLFKEGLEDEVVLAKMPIIRIMGDSIGFHLNNTENEMLKEAATEGNLYLKVYLDDNQEANKVTYGMEG